MPVSVTSFFVKANPVIPFLLQDQDLRGGLRVVENASFLLPTSTNPQAIPMGARVPGMLAVTRDNMHIHQLQANGVFIDRGLLGQAGGAVSSVDAPLSLDNDGNLSIDKSYLLPDGGQFGDSLSINSNGEPVWRQLDANPGVGIRSTVTVTASDALVPGAQYDFTVPMGRTNLLIEVLLDSPQLKIEGFGTQDRSENNPYTFISRSDQLFDDGSTRLVDGSLRYGRRYSFVANLEDPVRQDIYWRVTNQSNLPVTPSISITFSPIE